MKSLVRSNPPVDPLYLVIALRREGIFHSHNLNEELISPFIKHIASSWVKLFETNFFHSFENDALAAIEQLLRDVHVSAPIGLKDHVDVQGEACKQEARIALGSAVALVRQALQTQQRSISRSLSPHVQESLQGGYRRANEQTGYGCVARKKVGTNLIIADFSSQLT